MTYTLAQLRTKTRLRLGATSDDAMLTDTQLNESVNNGLRNFALERDWPWLQLHSTISTVVGQESYALPANCLRILAMSIDGSEPLEEVLLADLLRYQRNVTTRQPFAYMNDTLNIRLAPIPTQVYSIDLQYQRAENELTVDADTILTPNYYTDLLVTYAALDAAIVVRDQALQSSLLQLAKDQLGRTADALNRSAVGPKITTRSDTYI